MSEVSTTATAPAPADAPSAPAAPVETPVTPAAPAAPVSAPVQTQAVEVAKPKPAQFTMFGIFDGNQMGNSFEVIGLKNKDGESCGARMKLRGKKEQAAAHGLKGKENAQALAEAIMVDRDEALRKAKAYIGGLDANHTLAKFETRTLASGVESLKIEIHKVRRAPKGDTPEQIAAKLGLPVADVIAMIERQAKASQPVDVPTVTTSAPAPAPAPAA